MFKLFKVSKNNLKVESCFTHLVQWGKNEKKQGLLKNWPRMTGPTEHGVFKVIPEVISWRGIWHTNFEGGTRSSKKLASSERQGLNGKLLAEEGIGHTNCELHKGLFDMGTDIKLWKSSKKSQKLARKGDERCPGATCISCWISFL